MTTTRRQSQKKKEREKDAARLCRWRKSLSSERRKSLLEKYNFRRSSLLFDKKCKSHPSLASFLLRTAFTKKAEQSCIRFIKKQIKDFQEKMIMPIRPMWNSARLNVQSPQALRMFFSKSAITDTSTTNCPSGTSKLFCYGLSGMMNSTCPDPRCFKIFKIEKSLDALLCKISKIVQNSLRLKHGWDQSVDFNSVELKFYFGSDICKGIRGADGNLFKCNNNKMIGEHVDCQFFENGKQSSRDSADGYHPIATVTIGVTRELKFFEQTKKKASGKRELLSRSHASISITIHFSS